MTEEMRQLTKKINDFADELWRMKSTLHSMTNQTNPEALRLARRIKTFDMIREDLFHFWFDAATEFRNS